MEGIMSALQSALPAIQIGTAGTGLVGNILNSIQQGQLASAAQKNANLSPTQLSSMVSQATQPLNAGLVQTINNQVQADMATRGLAEAPGIFGAEEAQALAPFQQQNQQAALQLILEKLGLPASTLLALRSGGGGFANLLPLLTNLMKNLPGQQASMPSQQQLLNLFNTNWQSTPGLTTPNNYTGPTETDTSGAVSA